MHTLVLTLILSGLAQAQFKFTASECVDPSGFSSCFASVTSQADLCYSQNCNQGQCLSPDECYSTNPNCVQDCVCVAYAGWLNCALSSCWNQVYSCAYQALGIQALMNCDIASQYPPYFPPPPNTQGGCSCNIAGIYKAIHLYANHDRLECNNYISSIANTLPYGEPLMYSEECDCCSISGVISAFPNICPESDPSSIPFWSDIEDLSAASAVFSSCSTILPPATCTASPLGYQTPSLAASVGQFYLSGSVPAPGPSPVTDVAGTLTSPISGDILTWSLINGIPLTATAASGGGAAASGAAVTTTSGGSGGSSGGSSASGSSSGAGSTATSSSAGVVAALPASSLMWSLLLLSFAIFAGY